MPGKINGGPPKSGASEAPSEPSQEASVDKPTPSPGSDEGWSESGFERVDPKTRRPLGEEPLSPQAVPKAAPAAPSSLRHTAPAFPKLTLEAGLTEASSACEDTFAELSLCRAGRVLLEDLYGAKSPPPPGTPAREGLYRALEVEGLIEKGDSEGGLVSQMQWLLSAAPVKALNRHLRGDHEHAEQRRDYLAGIVLLMWALVGDGAAEGKLVKRGSFKVVDPNGRLFNHLRDYVRFATGAENPGFMTNDFAYARNPDYPVLPLSSHYRKDSEQYGIDVRFQGGAAAEGFLPGEHSHILFGQVHVEGQPYTFIKLEEVGLGTLTEMALHSAHFLASGKVESKSYREKDLHPELVEAYREYCAAKDLPPRAQTVYGMWHTLKEEEPPSPEGGALAGVEQELQEAMGEEWEALGAADVGAERADSARRARETFIEVAKRAGMEESLQIQTGEEVVLDYGRYAGGRLGSPAGEREFGWTEIEEEFQYLDTE